MRFIRRFAAVTAALALITVPAAAGSYGKSKASAEQAARTDEAKLKNIVQTADAAGSFTTLLAAVKAAGLQGALSGQGPFTVFAPSDEAFAKLPAGTVEGLLKDKEALKSILLYHVVDGKVLAADVVQLDAAKTLNGANVTIDASSGVTLNGSSRVVTADVMAKNGVIHVIDTVLLPPSN